jgi:hypothetical protein
MVDLLPTERRGMFKHVVRYRRTCLAKKPGVADRIGDIRRSTCCNRSLRSSTVVRLCLAFPFLGDRRCRVRRRQPQRHAQPSPVVLRSLEWTMCALERTDSRYMPSAGQVIAGRAETGQSQMACFLSQPEASSYPEFHPWMYPLDTLIPVTELGQGEYWRPDSSEPICWLSCTISSSIRHRLGTEPSGHRGILGTRQIEIRAQVLSVL